MLNIVVLVAVVLILAILVIIFRVSTLINVAKGKEEERASKDNRVQAALMIVFLVAGLVGFFYYSFGGLDEDYNQPIASEHGVVTEQLFWVTMAITCVVFIVTQIFLFGFAHHRFQSMVAVGAFADQIQKSCWEKE